MKVTRPVAATPSSMGAGDGRYTSNPYAAYTYGRSVRKKGAPDPDQHQVDIVNRDILNAEPAFAANIHDIADVLGIPDE